MKKFICVTPFQNPDYLKSVIYTPANNPSLGYDKETRFPIIPTINAYTENGEEIELINIFCNHENAKINYVPMKKEIDCISEEKNLKIVERTIDVPFNSSLEIQFKIFSELISFTNDNDMLFCDITYGTKVMNQVLTMAINYGYTIHNDVTIGCMVYGEYDFVKKIPIIYDITSLIYLNEIVKILADNKVSDPEKKIKAFLNWED
ncbi:TM1812 family CRISPR-associated protein [Ruminococcus flavefaciens]|uniref:TM1812 family CRISPR-associated protein n=1 Tax=Ruminococcus flavefaciens TaxID=1265 RepID=UPI000466522B|nr:TM1812 family CRISPR-associated protein [Ruminococcus flavefaciens]